MDLYIYIFSSKFVLVFFIMFVFAYRICAPVAAIIVDPICGCFIIIFIS